MGKLRFITVLGRLLVGVCLVSGFFVLSQDFQFFPGLIRGLGMQKGVSPLNLPSEVQSLFIETEDGERLESWHVGRELSNGPIALLFHGNADSVESTLHVQRWLLDQGIESYSLDYRGFGRSTGWPTEEGLYHDVRAFVGSIRKTYPRSERPLIMWGNSIGTGFAAYAATLTPTKALVLLSPYSSLRSVVSETPFFGFLAPFSWYEVPTTTFISSSRASCIIALHGESDTVILPHHSTILERSAGPRVNFEKLTFANTGHNDILARGSTELRSRLWNCLQRDEAPGSPRN